MPTPFPQTSPGLRTVDVNGSVIRGPIYLNPVRYLGIDGPNNYGIVCRSCHVSYNTEEEQVTTPPRGSYPQLYGFRAVAELDLLLYFDTTKTTGTWGNGLLFNFWADAFRQTAYNYAPLQFNFFALTGAQVWRGVYPQKTWNPVPAQGKETVALEMKLVLTARDLITDLSAFANAWETGAW